MTIRRYIISVLALAIAGVTAGGVAWQSGGVEQTSPGPRSAAELVESFDGLGAGLPASR